MATLVPRTFPERPAAPSAPVPREPHGWAFVPTPGAPTPEARQDRRKAVAFSRWMTHVINDGALVLLVSIGHRTGLFGVMADRAPSTAQEIATAAGLRERYVRDWLGAMVAAGIVWRSSDRSLHYLPSEHAEPLAKAGASRSLAALAQHVSLRAAEEDRIVECFQTDGVVPYAARPGFQRVVSDGSNQTVVAALLGSVLSLVPGLVDALQAGIQVLQIGCGDGRVLNLMARRFPESRFRGCDPSETGIERANNRAFLDGLNNVYFVASDVADLDERERYPLILDFDGIREKTRVGPILANVATALRPRGIFVMQESAAANVITENFGVPARPELDTVFHMQQMSESPTGEAEAVAMWGDERTRSLLLASGFDEVTVHRLPHHVQNCYFVAIKGPERGEWCRTCGLIDI